MNINRLRSDGNGRSYGFDMMGRQRLQPSKQLPLAQQILGPDGVLG